MSTCRPCRLLSFTFPLLCCLLSLQLLSTARSLLSMLIYTRELCMNLPCSSMDRLLVSGRQHRTIACGHLYHRTIPRLGPRATVGIVLLGNAWNLQEASSYRMILQGMSFQRLITSPSYSVIQFQARRHKVARQSEKRHFQRLSRQRYSPLIHTLL